MPSIPSATVGRLVTYLRVLDTFADQGVARASSDDLAREAHVSAFQVRKDLAYFGRFGTRGAGYDVDALATELHRILGLETAWNVAIIGMGRLGSALADYPNMARYNFCLRAAFDVAPAKIGTVVAGVPVYAMEELPTRARELDVQVALLTVPGEGAQAATEALADAGVRGVVNFASTVLDPPAGVHVEAIDFLAGLKRVSYALHAEKSDDERAAG
ncbi:MAG: redox-sensing transcriptional repressor Rex [Trueperaceae bacterium]|nr:redox-sensing transcriptional repressor Rex [Trueperaceae bacterium]